MIINRLSVKNKKINYKNLEFDFSHNGIYLLEGENGTGKTCLFEKIIFGKYDVTFDDLDLFSIWKHSRCQLFTYIPQNVIDNDLFVYEYISKENGNVSLNDTSKMLNDFKIKADILSKKFRSLSGGEKKKIQIICGLLKNSKYIFIDEPSNNLDDVSTNILIDKLNELKKDHIIVLITHDKRLDFDYNAIYELNKREVNLVARKNLPLLTKVEYFNDNLLRINLFKIVFKMLKNIPNFLTTLLITLSLIVIDMFVFLYYKDRYASDDVMEKNVILIQSTTEYDDEYYKNYLLSENIIIKEENRNRYINLNDIVKINKESGVEKIYMLDIEYVNNLRNKIHNNSLLDEICFLSIPDSYVKCYMSSYIDVGLNVLEGRLPRDNSNDVSISKNILIKYYGYNSDNVNDALGNNISISVNGNIRDFTICGFNEYDYINISYEDSYQFGVYSYSDDTYEEFAIKVFEYQKNNDSILGIVDEILIITKDGYEHKVLNNILETYPATYMQSNYLSSTWTRNYNNKLFLYTLIISIAVSSLMGAIAYFINRKTIKYNLKLINDYENYYINRRIFKSLYIISNLLVYSIFYGLIILANCFIEYSLYLNIFGTISFILIILPTILSCFGIGIKGIRI